LKGNFLRVEAKHMTKSNLKRGAVVLLLIAGLTTLNGDKALQLHASPPQQCSKAILLGGNGAGTTGLISSFSNPYDLNMGTFVPFLEAVRFVRWGLGGSPRPIAIA